MKRPKIINLDKAAALMGQGASLMKMHTNDPLQLQAYYVVPGGQVDDKTARKLITRPDVHPSKDGLFPGNDQTWRMGSHAKAA